MRSRASLAASAIALCLVIQATLASIAFAGNLAGWLHAPLQEGEDRWVPSLAITAGVTIQRQSGEVNSVIVEDMLPPPVSLRGFHEDDDLAVSPFVGFDLQVMSPALPVPTRPRIFFGAEILPTFAVSRDLAFEGDPGCVRGPEVDAPCARDEDGSRRRPFGEDSLNGEGSRTRARVQKLTYGASLGAAFPFEIADRPIRFKPIVAFMSYRINASGLVVNGACDPTDTCTDWTFSGFVIPGFLRESTLTATRDRRFYAVGPGFDVEMDTGRFGPIGSALFIGMRAYAVMGDRTIKFGTEETYDDQIGNDLEAAEFTVRVDPWIYRASLGIRFQWLGDQN